MIQFGALPYFFYFRKIGNDSVLCKLFKEHDVPSRPWLSAHPTILKGCTIAWMLGLMAVRPSHWSEHHSHLSTDTTTLNTDRKMAVHIVTQSQDLSLVL